MQQMRSVNPSVSARVSLNVILLAGIYSTKKLPVEHCGFAFVALETINLSQLCNRTRMTPMRLSNGVDTENTTNIRFALVTQIMQFESSTINAAQLEYELNRGTAST